MNNIELRWLLDYAGNRTLQYRKYVDTTVYAGMIKPDHAANYQWSEWTDVPSFQDPSSVVIPITKEMVEHLRDISDCPMMECKNALKKANGDMNLAAEFLRRGNR